MLRIVLILILCTTATALSFAQEVEVLKDTLLNSLADSAIIRKGGRIITPESYAKRYQPRKALLYSAILPGSGQLYNKKYWKIPIVFGGFYLLTKVAVTYNGYYEKYKAELYGLLATPSIPPPSKYTEAQLRSQIDTYRRQRDYFIILDGFMYILQMVDAHVDAHLKEFDLNPSLKVTLTPTTQQNYLTGRLSGFTLTLKF